MLFFELFPAFMVIVSMGVFILLVVLDQQGRREAHAERESAGAPVPARRTISGNSDTASAVNRRNAW